MFVIQKQTENYNRQEHIFIHNLIFSIMKTSTLKSVIIAFILMLLSIQANAQNLVGTRIDVQGSRYADQMWVFAVSSCTTGFDNGWDGYKMFGTSTLIPQIFAAEPTANFQIDAVPTLNDTYISFKAGEDTVYTLTFTSQFLETLYSEIYLVDSIANKKVSFMTTGTKYTFSVQPTDAPVKRFKIVAVGLTAAVTPTTPVVTNPVVTDPVVTDPVVTNPVVTDPVVTNPVVTDPVVTNPVVTNPVVTSPIVTTPVVSATEKNGKNEKNEKNEKNGKNINIKCSKKDLVITNEHKQKGSVKAYNAKTGKLMKTFNFNANGSTTISTGLPTGTYVINANSESEIVNETVIIN